jgi:hypothetical protein
MIESKRVLNRYRAELYIALPGRMTVPERLLASACQSASVRGGGGVSGLASIASGAEPSRALLPPLPASGADPPAPDPPVPPVPTVVDVLELDELPAAPLLVVPTVDEPPPAPVDAPELPPDPGLVGDSTSASHAASNAALVVISRKLRRSTRIDDFGIVGEDHSRERAQ